MAFVIREHRPGRWRMIVLALLVAWVLSGLLIYQYGWQQANTGYARVVEEREVLEAERVKLIKVNRDMQVQMSVLSRSAQVDREAKVDIARSMKMFQDETAELREEVSFYKGIISPEAGKTGLTVYEFSVRLTEDSLYHYKLILTQAGKNDRLVRGGVKVTFEGVMNNAEKTLQLSDIRVSQKPGKLAYAFRYFQELGGSFRFPEGYHPRRVIVKLLSKKQYKLAKTVRSFDWFQVKDGER